MFSKKEEVKSIGNPAGIGKGTGFGLRERDRDGIGLGHYRLRAKKINNSSNLFEVFQVSMNDVQYLFENFLPIFECFLEISENLP